MAAPRPGFGQIRFLLSSLAVVEAARGGDTVTFLEGVGGTLPLSSSRTRETLGSNVIIITSLLGGFDWYQHFGV